MPEISPDLLDMNRHLTHWTAALAEPRDPETEMTTPSLDEMAAAPGETQTKYRITYQRVGRRGGRDGSPAPAPLTVWAVTADGLAAHIAKDIQPYILSSDVEVLVDLDVMAGKIFTGARTGGTFTLEAVQVTESHNAELDRRLTAAEQQRANYTPPSCDRLRDEG